MWMLYVVVVIGASGVNAQFPRVCIGNISRTDSVCCPVPEGYSEPCGGAGVGSCQAIPPGPKYQPPAIPPWLPDDPRLDWPRRYFKNACVCEGERDGFMCQYCKFGFYGDDCSKKKALLKRRNALTLNAEEKAHLVRVFDLAKHTPSEYATIDNGFGIDNQSFVNLSVYDYLVHVHYFSTKNAEVDGEPHCIVGPEVFSGRTQSLDFAHNGPGFLTWHRLYLMMMEREMGRVAGDPFFALPYWNWSGAGVECSVCTDDLAGSINWSDPLRTLSTGSPFSRWESACELKDDSVPCAVYPCDLRVPRGPVIRDPEASVSPFLPPMEDVIFTLSQATFDLYPFTPATSRYSFRNCIEGFGGASGVFHETGNATMHIQVHSFFRGTISQVSSSPDDPLFFFHHTYIDKLFEVWLRMYNATPNVFPSNVAAGHNLHDVIVPFIPLYRHVDFFKQSYDLGYDYDQTEEMEWVRNSKKMTALSSSELTGSSNYALTALSVISAVALCCMAVGILIVSTRYRKRSGSEAEQPLLAKQEYVPF
ncbi:hypothetical protein CAPTEDRAFT_17975 [Capitella teleta]|uniref:Tyrosinase copper-binding domain-containing protein n=1 Tax=Capitella teleta TaxID=283909 RepID=R7VC10_CAPTE|nr:hypothetical protein CAPTEDRAFT_17975 [Capitella teleta]|eukprot:ELU13195.1 hypothetical protein CAPTEDRAFT_17975 [Capitella teleta]